MEYTHQHPNKDMIILMGKDPWTFVSILGISMVGIMKIISENINPIIATITALLGAILLGLGIVHKIMIIKREMNIGHRTKK